MTVLEVSGEQARWSDSEHLLATIIDVLVQANWMFATANSKQAPAMPPPLRRPGEPESVPRIGGKKSYTPAEMDRILASMKPKAG